MKIRDTRHNDMDQLVRLWKQMQLPHLTYHPDYYRLKNMETVEKRIRKYFSGLIDDADVFFRLAEAGQTILGHMVARTRETPPIFKTEVQLVIETIVVDEAHRHRGVFRQLLGEATAWGEQRKAFETCLVVDCKNTAVAAYQACGFEIYQHKMVRPAP